MRWQLSTVIHPLRERGALSRDSLSSRVCGDQIAKLVQETQTNDAPVARFFFFFIFLEDNKNQTS